MALKPTKNTQTKLQTFAFTAPEAVSVMLVGDFTNWQDKPISMIKREGGLWTASVNLPPGTYHYRFLVDGQWRDDPECTLRVPNPYGGENSVRTVRRS
ncbi:MAG: isoamylase early set domain-containing protein, partial [Verrucomicrobia bacterium]|nr:isoamylase early set domain-containing protein [Verrucomicrobiota bacterium]